jgi:hypothetical protein
VSARDYLAAVQQRADAATGGPWTQRNYTGDVVGNSSVLYGDRFGVRDIPWDDAEFIAASRTDVPRLVAALTAALDLHRPETDDDAPDGWPYCTACGVDVYEEPIPWPCETVRVITAALTPKENDS